MTENRTEASVRYPYPHKVAVVGAGRVGSTFAYALLLRGLVGEIVLIDLDHERAVGEAMDLSHAVPLSHPTRVWAGAYADCTAADLVVVAAGTAQRNGETRLDLVRRNAAIFSEIIPQIVAHNPTGMLLVATNPVDVLSYVAWKASGLPHARVMGSGTVLDTARFRYLLGEHLGVDPHNVHAHIIGEHGDSEVPVWSLATVAGMPLAEYCSREGITLSPEIQERIFRQTRDAAYEIIRRKGSTHFAVAVGLLRIAESILRDQHTVLSVSNLATGYCGIEDVYISLPAVVDAGGVERVVCLPLNDGEETALRRSAGILRGVLDQLEI